MAITLVGTATGHTNSSTLDFDINLPAALENDIVIVVTGGSRGNWTSGVLTSGYTELADIDGSAGSYWANLTVELKRMGATPDTSVTCLGPHSSFTDALGIAYVFRGVDAAIALDVAVVTADGIGSDANAPAITPITPGALLFISGLCSNYVLEQGDTVVATPSGFSDQVLLPSVPVADDGGTLVAAIKEWSGSGAEDPPAWSIDGDVADSWAAITIALAPVSDSTNAELTITGQTSTVTTFTLFEISGTLPNLKGSGGLADSFDLSGNLPELRGSFEFGTELVFDGILPDLNGSIDYGFQIEASFAALGGSSKVAAPFELVGDLPYITGSMDFGFIADVSLAGLQGSMDIEVENNFDIAASLPGLLGSMDLLDVFDISGILPELNGSMEVETYDYFNVSGDLPQLNGSLVWEATDDITMLGKLPALLGSAMVEIEQTMFIDADLVPLKITLFAFSDILSSELSGSFIPAADEIIRHRRGYDNG